MKTLKNIRVLAVFTAMAIICNANFVLAQTVQNRSDGISLIQEGKEFRGGKDTTAVMTLFAGTLSEGAIYLHWNVLGQECDGTYLVYRSSNDYNYELIGYKDGIGVSIMKNIAYYFTDESPHSGTNYYLVLHIADDNYAVFTSKIISIENRRESFISKTNNH